MSSRFINVDLDVESKFPLDYFSAQMANGTEVTILHCGENGERGYLARLECAEGGDSCEPDSVVNRFCDYLENLDDRARAEWDGSYLRSFDLGFEFIGGKGSYQCPIRTSTILRLSALGGALAISIYNHEES